MKNAEILVPTQSKVSYDDSKKFVDPISRMENVLNHRKNEACIIDRLDSSSSRNVISFLNANGFEITNHNSKTQKGLSCGYIAAYCAYQFYISILKKDLLDFHEMTFNYEPAIVHFNNVLNIENQEAEMLDSLQILKLVTSLTNDSNLDWFFILDVNMFKVMVKSKFETIKLKCHGNQKWAVFCINDLELNDAERLALSRSNMCLGNHWYTVAIILS